MCDFIRYFGVQSKFQNSEHNDIEILQILVAMILHESFSTAETFFEVETVFQAREMMLLMAFRSIAIAMELAQSIGSVYRRNSESPELLSRSVKEIGGFDRLSTLL